MASKAFTDRCTQLKADLAPDLDAFRSALPGAGEKVDQEHVDTQVQAAKNIEAKVNKALAELGDLTNQPAS